MRIDKIGTAAACVLAVAAQARAEGGGPGPAGLLVLVGCGIGVTAFVVWGRASFPAASQASRRALERSSTWRTFWVGLVNAVAAFLVVVALGKAGEAFPPAGIAGLAVAALVGGLAFRGALAIWPEYGHRILGPGADASDLQATLAGGALLTGTLALFPIGLVFFAYVLVRCLGVSVLAWVGKPAEPAPAAPSVPAA